MQLQCSFLYINVNVNFRVSLATAFGETGAAKMSDQFENMLMEGQELQCTKSSCHDNIFNEAIYRKRNNQLKRDILRS